MFGSSHLSGPFRKSIAPELERLGFKRLRASHATVFARCRGDVLQALELQLPDASALRVRFFANALIRHLDRLRERPGGAIARGAGGAELVWDLSRGAPALSHRTAGEAARDAELVGGALRGPLGDFFARTAGAEGLLGELRTGRWPELASGFDAACCLARLDRRAEAESELAAAISLGAGNPDLHSCQALSHALGEGAHQQLLSAWKAESFRALALEEIAPRDTAA